MAEGTPDAIKRRLEGDSLRVQLADAAQGEAARAVAAEMGLREIRLLEGGCWPRGPAMAQAGPVLLGRLQERGCAVDEVAIARPSLDDVYLEITGRRMRDAEVEEG